MSLQRPRSPEVTIAVASLLGAEALHAAAYVEHRGIWVWAGMFFAVVCVAEWLTAWALLARPGGTRAAWLAIALSLATLAVWALSRTVGVPFGPEQWSPEPLGWADSICAGFEVTTAVAAGRLVRRPTINVSESQRHRFPGALVAAAAVGALTVFGIVAPDSAHDVPMPTAAEPGPRPPG